MSEHSLLQEISEALIKIIGHDYLYFETALEVKVNPHTASFNVWAASVDMEGNVWVMDVEEDWYKLHVRDSIIISSLYQRVKLIESNYIKVA